MALFRQSLASTTVDFNPRFEIISSTEKKRITRLNIKFKLLDGEFLVTNYEVNETGYRSNSDQVSVFYNGGRFRLTGRKKRHT